MTALLSQSSLVPLAPGQFSVLATLCGERVLIDAEDAGLLTALAWHRRTVKHLVYFSVNCGPRAARYSLHLHRVIAGCQPGDGKVVDHRNGDTLDNRRANLRVTDRTGNARNQTRSKNQKAGGYKGVSWLVRDRKWYAHIAAGPLRSDGRGCATMSLGSFDSADAAARAYDAAATRYFGEFASLNFPKESP